MPKIPYKQEKPREDDEDYEIVSFEDFCDKSADSKNDSLSLNDNINYRLCYESDCLNTSDREPKERQELKETSLNGNKNASWKKNSPGFAPFGRSQATTAKGSLFSAVIPKSKADGESTTRDHRYQRFSDQRTWCERFCRRPGVVSTIILLLLVFALSIGTWWLVCWIIGNAWGDEHYRRLWERAHPDEPQRHSPAAPVAPYPHEKILTEYRYHDHNNLSTKNKFNAADSSKKKSNKKNLNYTERPLQALNKLCMDIQDDMRFDCFPQPNANREGCIERGCCWKEPKNTQGSIPYCFYPPDYDTFHFTNMTENKHGITVYYEKMRSSGYPDDFETVLIDFKYLSNEVLQIKIQDAENKRFEPPYPEIPMVPGPINDLKYRVLLDSSKIGYKVVRLSDNVTLLDTQDVGGLILSNKLLQVSSLLPTKKVYGLGERQGRLLLDLNWKTYTIFNHDTVPKEDTNLYGSHPFYLALEDSGISHGVLLLNSHPMDIILQPSPAITYRSIGGILDFVLFLGPSPAEVVSQYTGLIGRPFMPPYWSLGFHLCRFNYGDLKTTEEVWRRTRDAGIPYDVQWNDLDYMNNSNMFTYDHEKFAGLPQFVDKLHALGMHYIPLIDPGVSASEVRGEYPPYDRGLEMDVFIKNSSSMPFVGKVWNKGSTVWPDFTHPNATSYWLEMFKSYHQLVPFDGAWTDMNEPSNFLSGPLSGSCAQESFPYAPRVSGGEGLRSHTLCMEARHFAGPHLDWHNLFSLTEAIATNFALTEIRGKRPFIISRSSFVGVGKFAGHWSGDIASTWAEMEMSIPELLSFSLFGIPMMGADICGFRGNTSPQLCKRWMQLGAFYPFSRNHNDDSSMPQDPVSLGPEVTSASRDSLRLRYSLLPYMYTLFWAAHVNGETVARPLFFEFPSDANTHSIDTQFMIGPHLLIAPILKEGSNSTVPYLNTEQNWHNIRTGEIIAPGSEVDENSTVLIRGGGIIIQQTLPAQGPLTTTSVRSQPLQITVATPDTGKGFGLLYWDDGDSINSIDERRYSLIELVVDADRQSLVSNPTWWGHGVPTVSRILLYNMHGDVTQLTVNQKRCKLPECKFFIDKHSVLTIETDLHLDKPLLVKWTMK